MCKDLCSLRGGESMTRRGAVRFARIECPPPSLPLPLKFKYFEQARRDVDQINKVWVRYMGDHPVNRRCYGVDLQAGMLVEAAFVAEFPT